MSAKPREAEIGIRGAALSSGTSTTLTHSDIHAHNTFADREVVTPKSSAVSSRDKTLTYTFPPASVTKLALTLA